MPLLYDQCCEVYSAMLLSGQEGSYKGYLTYLFEELGLGVSRYTPVMRRLVAMGCVRQVAAGGRGSMSHWELIRPPTEKLYADTTSHRPRSRIRELEERVKVLEQWRREQTESAAS